MFKFSDKDLAKCSLSKYKGDKLCCRWCNTPLTGKQKRWCSRNCSYDCYAQHAWTHARKLALSRDLGMCVKCGSSKQLEINHKTPILGRHAENGCFHHVDGLETLCRNCHLKVTQSQRAQGLF